MTAALHSSAWRVFSCAIFAGLDLPVACTAVCDSWYVGDSSSQGRAWRDIAGASGTSSPVQLSRRHPDRSSWQSSDLLVFLTSRTTTLGARVSPALMTFCWCFCDFFVSDFCDTVTFTVESLNCCISRSLVTELTVKCWHDLFVVEVRKRILQQVKDDLAEVVSPKSSVWVMFKNSDVPGDDGQLTIQLLPSNLKSFSLHVAIAPSSSNSGTDL